LSFGIGAPAGSRGLYVGEVCVSLDEALANSRRFESGFERELVLYLIHGIMHLFGYDDRKAGERARMVKRQEEILERLCGDLDLSRVLTRR
jgi:probable rRNA maturation factor